VDDVLGRKLLKRLQVMQQRLLDQVTLLDPRPADVLLHQLARSFGDLGRDLGFLCHS
jgi:hypothetical protein